MFNDEELNKFEDIDKYFNSIRDQKIESDIWIAKYLTRYIVKYKSLIRNY